MWSPISAKTENKVAASLFFWKIFSLNCLGTTYFQWPNFLLWLFYSKLSNIKVYKEEKKKTLTQCGSLVDASVTQSTVSASAPEFHCWFSSLFSFFSSDKQTKTAAVTGGDTPDWTRLRPTDTVGRKRSSVLAAAPEESRASQRCRYCLYSVRLRLIFLTSRILNHHLIGHAAGSGEL